MGEHAVKFKNRQQMLMIVAGAAVGYFVLDQAVISPLVKSWKGRSESVARLRSSIQKGKSMMGRESVTRGLWNDIRKTTLPTDASQSEKTLLEAFDRWSQDSRVTINSIKPQWKRGTTEDYSLLECRVDAAGDLSTLAKFLYEVEHSDMALRIESLELASRDNDGRQLALGLSVSGLRLAPLDENR